MPSSHLILCRPLLLLPPTPPSIRVFSNESTLRMRLSTYRASKTEHRTCPVVQRLRIRLPMQGTNTSSIPGPGRFHMLWGNWGWHHNYWNPHALEPMLHNKRAAREESSPAQLERANAQHRDPTEPNKRDTTTLKTKTGYKNRTWVSMRSTLPAQAPCLQIVLLFLKS